jgi:hypothetical protein
MAEPTIVRGMILAIGNGATPEVFTKIAAVIDYKGPEKKRTTVDTSNQDSGIDKEKRFGMIDNGKVTFNTLFDPRDPTHDSTTGVAKRIEDAAPANFKLVTNVPGTGGFWGYNFKGGITEIGDTYKLDDKMIQDIGVEITGKAALSVIDISGIC